MIVVPGFPLEKAQIRGGVHAAVLNLLEGFSELNVLVRLVSIDPSLQKSQVQEWNDRISIHYCAIRKMPAKIFSYLLFGPGIMKEQLNNFQPDILHYQIGGNFLLTKARVKVGIPCVLTIHGISLEEARVNKSLKKKLTMYWNGYLSKFLRPVHIINISAYSKKLVNISNNAGHPIIYNAVSKAYFEVADRNEPAHRLLYVGVVNERKNLMVLLEAMSALQAAGMHYRLTVVGGADQDPAYYEQVTAFAKEQLPGAVEFAGWRSQKELPLLLAAHDIMVLPSRQETLPMSVAEAMAAGKVVIASRVGALPEMIEPGQTGFLFDPAKPEELVDILKRIYNDTSVQSAVSARARAIARERFDARQIARQTLAYYQQILQQEGRAKA
jgi:glycosyltransferase involved in cell wall biosynthesis